MFDVRSGPSTGRTFHVSAFPNIRIVIWAFALLALALNAAAARLPANHDALRRLAVLPPLSFFIKAGFTTTGHLRWEHETPDPREQAALQNQVRARPEDPDAHLQLGRWLLAANQTQAGALACSNAAAGYRRQLEVRPDDGRLLARLGEALWGANQQPEAEARLRRAVQLAPQDAEAWLVLGRFLDASCVLELTPDPQRQVAARPEEFLAMLAQLRPSAAQFERADQRRAEALRSLDQALTLAPQQAELYEARAKCRLTGALIRAVQTHAADPRPDLSALTAATMSTDCLPDLRRWVEVDVQNPRRLGLVAVFEALATFLEQRPTGAPAPTESKAIWKTLPADVTRAVSWKLERLVEIAESTSPRAAEAAEVLGMVRLGILQDYPAAEAGFRRAVALDAARENAWQGLIAALANGERYQEMRQVCDALVKRADSGHHRLCLAKANAALDRWDEALSQCRAAAKREPDSFLAHAALAAALVRAETGDRALREAGLHARLAIERSAGASDVHRIHLRVTAGLILALDGNVAEARQTFQEVLRLKPDYARARQALDIVATWQ